MGELKDLDQWFLDLSDGRQKVLREDKWLLASAYGDYVKDFYLQQVEEVNEMKQALKEASGLIDVDGENIYRKTTHPIVWWEGAANFLTKEDGSEALASGDEYMFHVEAQMTREEWYDFARILLEQEGE